MQETDQLPEDLLNKSNNYAPIPITSCDEQTLAACYELIKKKYGDKFSVDKFSSSKFDSIIIERDENQQIVGALLLKRKRIYAASAIGMKTFKKMLRNVSNSGVYFGTISVAEKQLFAAAVDIGFEVAVDEDLVKKIAANYNMNVSEIKKGPDGMVIIVGTDGYEQYLFTNGSVEKIIE